MANIEHHRYSEIDEIIPGKGGWSGREGQPPGSSKIVMHMNPKGGGGVLGGGGGASRLGNSRWGVPADLVGLSSLGEPLSCRWGTM